MLLYCKKQHIILDLSIFKNHMSLFEDKIVELQDIQEKRSIICVRVPGDNCLVSLGKSCDVKQ